MIAKYYTNTYGGNYNGKVPYKVTVDANIDFYGYWTNLDGNNNLPSTSRFGNEWFSAIWQGEIRAPITGWVGFYASHDDGARMKIDEDYVFNNWNPQGSLLYNSSGQYYMEEGKKYHIEVEMFENGGGDVMRLFWEFDKTGINIINSEFLYHTEALENQFTGYGNDLDNKMQGNDNGGSLYGLAGDDTLIGGAGADFLYGGSGSDTFVFSRGTDVEDTIMDWTIDDKIDFSAILSESKYIGQNDFSGSDGEIRFNYDKNAIEVDIDADSYVDLCVNVKSYSSVINDDSFSDNTFLYY